MLEPAILAAMGGQENQAAIEVAWLAYPLHVLLAQGVQVVAEPGTSDAG